MNYYNNFDGDSTNVKLGCSLSSMGLGTILFVVFLILRLCKVIMWPWIFVFLPLIIEVGLVIIAIVLSVILAIISAKDNMPNSRL